MSASQETWGGPGETLTAYWDKNFTSFAMVRKKEKTDVDDSGRVDKQNIAVTEINR